MLKAVEFEIHMYTSLLDLKYSQMERGVAVELNVYEKKCLVSCMCGGACVHGFITTPFL